MAIELTRNECDTLLREQNIGVLSLANGEDTYAIPESFGYNGENLYFQLVYDEDSDKMSFLEMTRKTTFTVYTESPAESVIVQGKIDPVSEDNQTLAATAIAENAVLPSLNVSLDKTPEELMFEFYRLQPESISGRRFESFTLDGEED
jgi:nitroimidazol reductase NimA-like FMN-containing flavoprotein (pyridoxamine 5'-phosphate oxidase superfamily)